MRELDSPNTVQPAVALLGRHPFTTIVTNAGGGQTRFGPIALNRWRSDPTLDDYGQFVYIRDLAAGRTWSAAHQPVRAPTSFYKARFDGDSATFERTDGDVETRMQIAVDPYEVAEFRKVTLTNKSRETHGFEITSYSEIVIATPSADRGHPAFSSLFVQTEWIPESNAILAMRRPRSALNNPIWCAHLVTAPGQMPTSCETDRARFVGRGRTVDRPRAMDAEGELSGTTGAVLDPVFAIRTRLTIPAGESRTVTFTTLIAEDRQRAIESSTRFRDADEVARCYSRACVRARELARELGVGAAEAEMYEQLAGEFLFPSRSGERIDFSTAVIHAEQRLSEAALRRDLPVLLAVVRSEKDLDALGTVKDAHRYWKAKGIANDLIVLVDGSDDIAEAAAALLGESSTRNDQAPGSSFVVRSNELGKDERSVLEGLARLTIECAQLDTVRSDSEASGNAAATESRAARSPVRATKAEDAGGAGLEFFNGIGGFNDRNEYELRLTGETLPPAPWINVIANPRGGFIVSETGAGPTWAINSSLFRLTPWHNDPVSDRIGDCIYIRDDDTGLLWTSTPAPIREESAYTVRHGAGYSVFEHEHDEIMSSLLMGAPLDDAVKLQVLSLTNTSSRVRTLTLTAFAEWVLGGNREATRLHVRTSFDAESGAMLARNPLDPDYGGQCAYFAISGPVVAETASREEFLGRNGDYTCPDWLAGFEGQSVGRTTTDPCAALVTKLSLEPGETKQVAVVLGAADGAAAATRAATHYRVPAVASAAIRAAQDDWRTRLDMIRVKTPERSFDLLLNQWALYQALSSRVWGRIALFQSSGAYGFRDQLQDVMAFVYAEPSLAREQILRAASRQFEEGDVQHWWHPDSGRGIRTRFSDDLVWLPFVVDHYLRVTRDFSILEEETNYIRMRQLEPGEDEVLAIPAISEKRASVFDHCVHALDHATTSGTHGLPLIGSGDWNDGMNRVGVGGTGESVWLAWFLIDTLRRFAAHADARHAPDIAASFRQRADAYTVAIEQSAWDGEWYRRAYYDDGTPIGSHTNTECQIDSIAQSWSVISGAGDAKRTKIAMESLHERLVREDARLVMLLTPPFDRGSHDPGYIRGYVPGVRENGAQYTHAALWAVLATAMQGDGGRATTLFQMINPVTHASTRADVSTYKVEPYVVAADVYTAQGHAGRGGWTWYTGSASWLYRVGLEAILGFIKRGDTLEMNPCIPSSWNEFSLEYRFGESTYAIHVVNPSGVATGVRSVVMDGVETPSPIHLMNDGLSHEVTVTMGSARGG